MERADWKCVTTLKMSSGKRLGEVEFIGILALLMSISAYAIDAMLPALGIIGAEFNVTYSNQPQLIISALFVGLSLGQLFYGPLSDSVGRRSAMFLSSVIFIIGSLLCVFSRDMSVMLLGRVLQGFGASGPRIITMALVRDQFRGDAMARIMSFVTGVFIIVPTLAPAIGQVILNFSGWRMVFVSQLLLGVLAVLWFGLRQRETLPKERRKKFSLTQFYTGIRATLSERNSLCYALASGFVLAAFMGYLNSAQQVYQEYFQLGDRLPLFFGILALSIGTASFINSQLVLRLGMRKLVWVSISTFTFVAVCFFVCLQLQPQWVSLQTFMISMMVIFFCSGILFGNLNSLALEPLGEIAGTASSVIGTIQSFTSVTLGLFIGQMYDGTLFPLIAGFATMGSLSVLVLSFTRPYRTLETAQF